jgi:chitinase
MRVKVASSIAAAAVAVGVIAVAAPTMASAAASDVNVDWTITQDWGTGFQGSVRVTNNSDRTISPWSVTVPYAHGITSAWDATASPTADGYRFSGPSWSTALASGSSATFGFIGSPRGGALVPDSCSIAGGTCSIGGAAAAPAATATPSAAATPTVAPAPAVTPTPTAAPPSSASTPATPSAPSVSAAAVTVDVKVTSDWGSGRNVDLTITNTGSTAVSGWSVSMPWAGASVSMWNATANLAGGVLTATNVSWNGSLAPGASATVGLTDTGSYRAPTTCTSTAGSCMIAGAATVTPAPTATPTTSPTATSATPYVPKAGAYQGDKKLIAYYPAWATYARGFQVSDIPGQKLTHINYAFANIQNGRCVLGDSYADIDKAFAGDTWDQGALRGNFGQLRNLKAANPGLRTMISIGGWTWSENFAAAAASDASRKDFASSCVTFMKQYGFDGIDVDWEYPVSGGLNAGSAADKQNYTALLKEFRTQLSAEEAKDGRSYSLSIAAPAGPSIIPNLESAKIGSILDWMNLMSYDFHGSWDPITGHNAPMTVGPKDTAAGFSITDAVDSYLKAGFPATKLVLGVPFYGRGWENVGPSNTGLYQSGTAASVGTWEKGVFDYSDIKANYLPTMTRSWDASAQVPYLYDPARRLWISYDDAQSMKIKADYIKATGLGGAMIWEITGDRSQELLDTLVSNL